MRTAFALVLALIFVTPAAAQVTAVYDRASATALAQPYDMALGPDGAHLFVADAGNNVVQVLEAESLKNVGTIGAGELNGPRDVAIDPSGRLLVADTGNDRVLVYAIFDRVAGRVVQEFPGLSAPASVGAVGEAIVAASTGSDEVVVYRGREEVARVGGRGDEAGEFVAPLDVTAGPRGRVFVSDPGNARVQAVDLGGIPIERLGGDEIGFVRPTYLDFDGRGWLYVADAGDHRIRVFDAERAEVFSIGMGEAGAGRDRFDGPNGVVARSDVVWVADTGNGRIVRYRLKGVPEG